MAKDDKVISLEQRRRGRKQDRPHTGERHSGEERPSQEEAAAAEEAAAEAMRPSGTAADQRPVPGRLVWLYCPTCRSIEYTEMELAGGRVHNVCGTQVHEAAVELDLRAEATLAEVNLERLELLQAVLDGQRQRYEEYRHRLNLAAGKPLEPYAADSDTARELPVAEMDALGLLVSRFFHNPARHFPELAGSAERSDAGEGEPPPAPDEE